MEMILNDYLVFTKETDIIFLNCLEKFGSLFAFMNKTKMATRAKNRKNALNDFFSQKGGRELK